MVLALLLAFVPGARASDAYVRVFAGDGETCGITTTGITKCWGYDSFANSLKRADTGLPRTVARFGKKATDISTVGDDTMMCAVVSGAVLCSQNVFPARLMVVPTLTSGATEVSSFGPGQSLGEWSCAVVGGAAKCWGANNCGSCSGLGDGSTGASRVPVVVAGAAAGAEAVEPGCVLVNGGVSCWGYNGEGGLGDGSTTDSAVPVGVVGLGSGVTAISGDCAIQDGAAKCWGSNHGGALGDGGAEAFSSTPVQVAGLGAGVTALASGGHRSCALVSGAVRCWGVNVGGLQWDPRVKHTSVPVAIPGLESGVTDISASATDVCVVQRQRIKCWGEDSNDTLGVPSTHLMRNFMYCQPRFGLAINQRITYSRRLSFHCVVSGTGSTRHNQFLVESPTRTRTFRFGALKWRSVRHPEMRTFTVTLPQRAARAAQSAVRDRKVDLFLDFNDPTGEQYEFTVRSPAR